MSLETLHDKARRLGVGRMYETHWARDDFRDLFDHASAAWGTSSVVEKANDLRALATAGISLDELLAHYRAGHAGAGDPAGVIARLPATLRVYQEAGYHVLAQTFVAAAAAAAAAADAPAAAAPPGPRGRRPSARGTR